MFCMHCGTANPEAAKFCIQCGKAVAGQAGVSPGAGAQAGSEETSGKAIGSLICGLLFFIFPAALGAIVMGHLALSDIRKSAGRLKGHGMAVAGLVLGYAGVAIIPFILIVAAIAIPNLIKSRMVANEVSALGSLRVISVAAMTYDARYSNGFPLDLASMVRDESGSASATCDHPQLLAAYLAAGQRHGYIITYTALPADEAKQRPAPARGCTTRGAISYTITAYPVRRGNTGQRSFFTDQTGVIRFETQGPATTQSSPVD